jgi:hypothetical protein
MKNGILYIFLWLMGVPFIFLILLWILGVGFTS